MIQTTKLVMPQARFGDLNKLVISKPKNWTLS